MSSRTVRSEKTRTAPKSGYVRTSKGDKFVGGAAVARSNAVRKGRGNRILRPGEKQRSEQLVPRGLSPFEHFFAGLLKGEASEFLQNDTLGTWNSICKRLRLPFPQGPLKHYYNDQKQHFFYRASLIIEECRYAISQGLRGMQRRSLEEAKHTKNQNQRQQSRHQRRNAPPSNTMILSLTGVESREKTGHCTLTFVKERGGPFTLDEVQNLRQGTIFACVSENLAPTVANSVLGSILASNREAMINSKSFSVMVYKPVSKSQESIWRLTPVASLLPEQRKFEACVNNNTANIPFLLPLLGGKKPTHIKFSEQDNGNLVSVKVEHEENPNNSLFSQEEMEGSAFHLPTLNRTQEKAAATFLNSEPKTITLIQGPPGTGKTTLLVHIICQYLMESIAGDRARCLMVCAPTNKAVSVLCTRFLDTLQEVDQLPCNILLVGDDDKLLDDEQSRINRGKDTSTMRSIFLYTWIQTVLDRLSVIQNFLARPTRNQTEVQRILDLTVQLVRRLRQSLSRFPQDMGNAFDRVIKLLRDGIVVGDITQKEAMNTIGALKKEIEDWKPDLIWQDLLSSAHLIFCTLASSGSGLLKRSIGQVDDLIVDEAAASCEPEMYIPFHFMPQRLLAVGDPKQLPATVISQIAADRGLDKSLHERLMYDSDYPHIMLDVQYRMKPEISQFPSKQFYSGNVFDGPNVVSPDYSGPLLLGGQNLAFLDINGVEKQARSGSFENYAEAQAVVKLVQDASRLVKGRWQSADRIRIITFYMAQVSLIKRLLHQSRISDVVVATVDSSQGSEADIVIVSFVRSRGNSKNASVGFLSDDRRVNVAITRAKYQLICVGNAERMSTLSKPNAQTIKALAVDAFQRNCVLSAVHNNNGYQQKRLNREMHDDRNTKRARQGEHDDRNTKRARPGEPGASLKHQMDNSARVHQSNTAIHVSTTNGKARLPPDDNSNEYDRGPNGKSGSQHPKDSAALQESDGRAEKARGPTSDSMKPAASRRKTVALCSSSQSSSSSESSSLSDSSSDSSTSDDSPDDESVKPDDESVKVNSLLGSKPNMTSSTPPITAERVKTEVIAVDDTSEGNVEKNPASSNLEQDDMMEDFGLENSQMNSQPEEVEQDSTSPQHFDGNSTMSNADKQQDSAFEPGRPEMPLDMKSSMVMSYDSDSCGDNRSEVDSESDEEGKTESRTNMVLGTSGFTNETSVAADCYDIDI